MKFDRLKSKAYAKSKEAMADLEVEFEAKDEEKLAGMSRKSPKRSRPWTLSGRLIRDGHTARIRRSRRTLA